jgi:GT2 family glycosyltransferase
MLSCDSFASSRLTDPKASASAASAVSVVIPTHNGRQWIAGSIASVLRQEGANVQEVLVVDDASDDGTPDYVAGLGWAQVRVIPLRRNMGAANARNVGVEEARGALIAFNDQDDIWLPGKLAKQQRALAASPDAVGVVGGYARLAADGVSRWHLRLPVWRWSPEHVPQLHDPQRYVPATDGGCYLQSLLVRRESVLAAGGFRVGLPLADDLDFIARLSERFPLVCVPEAVFLYRLGDHNQTAPGVAKTQQFLAARAYVHAAEQSRRNGVPEPDVLSHMRDYQPSRDEIAAFQLGQEMRLLNTLLLQRGLRSCLWRLASRSLWRPGFASQLFARGWYWIRHAIKVRALEKEHASTRGTRVIASL